MARLFNSSVQAISRPAAQWPHVVLAAIMFVVLVVGVVYSAIAGAWPIAAIFFVALGAMSALSWFTRDSARRSERGEMRVVWESTLPDIQRQSMNVEVAELARILDIEPAQQSDLQSAFLVAEDLALRQIQQEESVPLLRHVSVAGVPFDAVLAKNELLICCEVTFLVEPVLRQEKLDAMIRKIRQVKQVFQRSGTGKGVRLMLVLITQLVPEDEERLRHSLGRSRFQATPVDIDVRLIDFEALQRIFVTD